MKDNVVQEFIGAIQKEEPKNESIYSATVSRIDDEGVVWVYVAGANKETPTDSASSEVKKGDVVNVMYQNNKLYILGNYSDPASGIAKVRQVEQSANIARQAANNAVADAGRARVAAEDAEATANSVRGIATRAEESAATAKTAADTAYTNLSQVQSVLEVAQWIATHGTYVKATTFNPNATYYTVTATQVSSPSDDDKDSQGVLIYYELSSGVYVRTTDTSVQSGKTYYTVVGTPVAGAKAEDISQYYTLAVSDAMADYIQSHLALTDEGLWLIKDGSGYKLKLTNYGSCIVAPDGTTVVNQNTADGNIIRALDGTVIAHLGYGDGQADSGTAEAPYYTLGTRTEATNIWDSTRTYVLGSLVLWGTPLEAYVCIKENSTGISPANDDYWKLCVGNYSCAEGHDVVASGYASHAEGGYGTTAIGPASHAEGDNTRASGMSSHAEGTSSVASGTSSHAEGISAKATAHASHAQNVYTNANYEAQTVIGKFNDNQSGNAFEIGNGTETYDRSNAFEVDWSGNVNIASGGKYKINGENLSASDVGAVPTTRKVNNKALSADITLSPSDVNASGKTLIAEKSISVGSIPANGYKADNVSYSAPSGYQAIAIAGWYLSGSNTSFVLPARMLYDQSAGTIGYGLRNTHSAAVNTTLNVRLLCVYVGS